MKRITSLLLAIVLFAGLVLTGAPVAFAASEMKTSDALVEILKAEEGFSSKPYWDYGQYTVGYGTRCPDDMLEEYKTNGITEEAAELLLRNYLTNTENTINTKFIDAHGLTLTQGQFDALISFTYNCGTGWIKDTNGVFNSAVRKNAKGSELLQAFSLWCSAGGKILPGLVRRRLSEANMFLNGEYSKNPPSNFCHVYYNGNGGSVSYRIQGYDSNEGVAPAYTPTREGHTFLGWFTKQTGGSQVTVLTSDLSGDTLYARWDGGSEGGNQDGKDEGGEQTPAPETPKGVTVTVTATDVNLRKGPGTNYGIVGSANKGDKMTITETASGTGYEWGKAGEKWIVLKFTNYAEVVNGQQTPPEETTGPETTEPETTETTEPETTAPETTEPAEPAAVTGKVKANGGLSVRKGPGTGYARIKYLDNGAKVTITQQKTVGSMTWGYTGEGWVSMSYIVLDKTGSSGDSGTTETTPPTTTEKVTGTIKAEGGLAVRRGPGLSYGRIRYIANGTKVTVSERKDADGMNWGNIGEGWVSMNYVALGSTQGPTSEETTPPAQSGGETVNITGTVKASGGLAVRRGAGTTYGIARYLGNGSRVTITQQKEVGGTKWGNMGEGWICMDYVVADGTQSEGTSENTKTVTADCLRVRQTPSTSAQIVGYYYQGAKVQILETQQVDTATWGKTPKGWVSMDYVK